MMRFIDRPGVRAVMWDMPSFLRLREATDAAKAEHQRTFTVDLGRRYKRVEFETAFAEGVCVELAHEFAVNPMPVLPENREGREP